MIVYDNWNYYTIINLQTMEKIHSIRNPKEGSLRAAFMHKFTNTFYLAYNDYQMIGYDGDKYKKKEILKL